MKYNFSPSKPSRSLTLNTTGAWQAVPILWPNVTSHALFWKSGALIRTSTQCRSRFFRGRAAELAFTHGKQRQAFSARWTYLGWLFVSQSPHLVQLPRHSSSKQIIQHSNLRSQPRGSWLALRNLDGGHQLRLLRQAQALSSQRLTIRSSYKRVCKSTEIQ